MIGGPDVVCCLIKLDRAMTGKADSHSDSHFSNIVRYAEDHHQEGCPCGLDPQDFQEASPPSHYDKHQSSLLNTNILLFSKQCLITLKAHIDAHSFIKTHFVILAQKFHPDKNRKDLAERCTAEMQLINNAYSNLMQDKCFLENSGDKVVQNEKIYTKENEYTVTCQHTDSFSVYGYCDHSGSWITKLTNLWGVKPKSVNIRGSTKNTVQYGDDRESLYITVYENGTIHVQGIMALEFSIDKLPRLLSEVLREKITTQANRFSNPLKKSLKLFKLDSPAESLMLNGSNPTDKRGSGNGPTDEIVASEETSINLEQEHAKPQSQVGLLKAQEHSKPQSQVDLLTAQLQEAVNAISTLQKEMEIVQKINKQLETEVKRITKDNHQLMTTLGPRIGKIEAKLDQCSTNQWDNPLHFHSPRNTAAPTLPNTSSTLVKPNTTPQTTNPPPNAKVNRSKEYISFDHTKCVVISSNKNRTGLWKIPHNQVKREVGKCCGNVIIDRINKTGKSSQNLMVQLASEVMVNQVLDSWKGENLGGTTVRKTQKESAEENVWGVAKGVPDDMTQDVLQTAAEENNASLATRMYKSKQGQKITLKTIKVKFNTRNDLEAAIKAGITLEHVHVRVEEFVTRKMIIQCYRCERYGHMSTICDGEETCTNCGEKKHCEDTVKCDKPAKCVNCNGAHGSRDKSQCRKYQELNYKLNLRSHNG